MSRDHVKAAIDNARVLYTGDEDGGREFDGEAPGEGLDEALPDDLGPDGEVDETVLRECAKLDQSDTDNGHRLRLHFGADLAVVASDNTPGGEWACWSGKFWDVPNGAASSIATAQKIGARIALEIPHLALSKADAKLVEQAAALGEDDKSDSAKHLRAAAEAAEKGLKGRRAQRWRFAVTSKNAARIRSMLDMAAVHLRRSAKGFNADARCFACETHTIRLVVEADLDCPDPDVTRKVCRVEAVAGHNRGDYLTGLVPAPYDPTASAPKFEAFLIECMPDADLRRTLRAYCGMGLLGVLAQKLMFHYGAGANGKSVFLAVLRGVLGPSLSVGLPKETILGQGERGAGQASPDLIRLFGKRLVCVDELKEGESLREDLVKRLTGGDPMVVRAMYEGYVEFCNVATPHMVGNGMPKIEGADNGIWRRVLVMPWNVTIAEDQRREFDEIVADLLSERSGILNWLIAGASEALSEGLYVAPAARAATEAYRTESDQIGDFLKRCVLRETGPRVQARHMYQAYRAWALANALTPRHETKFGRDVKKVLKREDGTVRFYLDCRLSDEALGLLANAPPVGPAPEDRE